MLQAARQPALDAVLAALDEEIAKAEPARLAAILAALSARASAASARLLAAPPPQPETEARNLDIGEAAGRLGVSVEWLYRNWKSLPFAVRIGRRLLFASAGLDRYVRQRIGRNTQ